MQSSMEDPCVACRRGNEDIAVAVHLDDDTDFARPAIGHPASIGTELLADPDLAARTEELRESRDAARVVQHPCGKRTELHGIASFCTQLLAALFTPYVPRAVFIPAIRLTLRLRLCQTADASATTLCGRNPRGEELR